MKPILVVGLGLGPEDLTPRARRALEQAQVLAGGRRLLEFFPDHPGRRLVLAGDLAGWLDEVERLAGERQVAVLASGDPGFYGIGARLRERFGPERLEIIPAVSAVQAAFARLKLPWHQAEVVSLHGRGHQGRLWEALFRGESVAVYTDPKRDPAWLARLMLERDQAGWGMWVLEELGTSRERVRRLELEEAAGMEFAPLNLVVLQRGDRPRSRLRLGMPESAYTHQGGLITKREVRCAALGLLELGPGMTLWDLGAGCGSVGLEASLLMPGGRVVAVEKEPCRVRDIQVNRRRYQVGCLETVCLRLPRGMDELPRPERVFVGGGGDQLAAILENSAARLAPGGVLVAAVVLMDSLQVARRALAAAGLTLALTQVQAARSEPLAGDEHLKALNPVWLLQAKKPPRKDET